MKIILTISLLLLPFISSAQSKEERAILWVKEKISDRIKRGNPELSISTEQHKQFYEIQLENQHKIATINESALTEEEKNTQRQVIYKSIWQTVSTILDPKQLEAWKLGKPNTTP